MARGHVMQQNGRLRRSAECALALTVVVSIVMYGLATVGVARRAAEFPGFQPRACASPEKHAPERQHGDSPCCISCAARASDDSKLVLATLRRADMVTPRRIVSRAAGLEAATSSIMPLVRGFAGSSRGPPVFS